MTNKRRNFVLTPEYLSRLMAIFIIAATIIAYKPAWNAGYIWDDNAYVTENKLLSEPDGLKKIWFSPYDLPSQYFPLTYTVFRIEYRLWGLNPAGYHGFNILLHLVNALLLWKLLQRLKIPGAWLAAAIFALHPVHVESVAWITELKNILSLCFCLISMHFWVSFFEERSGTKYRYYALSLLLYLLALFSKTTACTLPAAMLLILWLNEKPVGLRRIMQVAPFFALGAGMGVVTMLVERTRGTYGDIFSLGLTERVLVASRAIWFYAGKLLWPVNLTFSYPRWEINPGDPLAYGWLAAAAVFCVVIFRLWRSVNRGVKVALLFYVITLCPLLGFIMLYTFQYTFVADHYQYAASIGPIALAAAGIVPVFQHIKKYKQIIGALTCGVLLILLGSMTWRQAGVYKNSETLWRDTITKNNGSWLAHNNLGAILSARGDIDEAITHFEKTVELNPYSSLAQYNLGNNLLLKGRIDEAIPHLEEAFEEVQQSAVSWNRVGDKLLKDGDIDGAEAAYRKTLLLYGGYAVAHRNLNDALLRNGHTGWNDAYQRMFKRVCSVFADSYRNLGSIMLCKDRFREAVIHFNKALELHPDDVQTLNTLSCVLEKFGQASVSDRSGSVEPAKRRQPDSGRESGSCINVWNCVSQACLCDPAR